MRQALNDSDLNGKTQLGEELSAGVRRFGKNSNYVFANIYAGFQFMNDLWNSNLFEVERNTQLTYGINIGYAFLLKK